METSTVLEIVKTKLQAVDGECESKARVQINTCYESATYNGTRFVVPFFPDVSTVWLELIEEKERRSLEELSKVLSHPNSEIDPKGQVEIEKLVDIFFAEPGYVDRLSGFSEGLGRKAMSYGIQFDPSIYRFDLHDSAYRAGVKNALRKARRSLTAEVSPYSQPSAPDAIKNLKRWQSFIRSRPLQSLAYIVGLAFLVLLSSVVLPELIAWVKGTLKS